MSMRYVDRSARDFDRPSRNRYAFSDTERLADWVFRFRPTRDNGVIIS